MHPATQTAHDAPVVTARDLHFMKLTCGARTVAQWCGQLALYSAWVMQPIPRRKDLPTSTSSYLMPDGGACTIVTHHNLKWDPIGDLCYVDGICAGNRYGALTALAERFAKGLENSREGECGGGVVIKVDDVFHTQRELERGTHDRLTWIREGRHSAFGKGKIVATVYVVEIMTIVDRPERRPEGMTVVPKGWRYVETIHTTDHTRAIKLLDYARSGEQDFGSEHVYQTEIVARYRRADGTSYSRTVRARARRDRPMVAPGNQRQRYATRGSFTTESEAA